jgi:DNA polymerase-1
VFGRRLYLPEINSPTARGAAAPSAQAINAPMQGTAADLIKLSMVAGAAGAGRTKARHQDDHAGA